MSKEDRMFVLLDLFSYGYLFTSMEDTKMIYYLNGLVDGLYLADDEERDWWLDLFYAACELRERRVENETKNFK